MPLGTYKEALSARSTEKKILDVSQDGGIVSALLCYALDEGILEGAVVAGTPDENWRPQPTVVTSADEVIAAAHNLYGRAACRIAKSVKSVRAVVHYDAAARHFLIGEPRGAIGQKIIDTSLFGVHTKPSKYTAVDDFFHLSIYSL